MTAVEKRGRPRLDGREVGLRRGVHWDWTLQESWGAAEEAGGAA